MRYTTRTAILAACTVLAVLTPAAFAQPGTVLSHQKISETQGGFAGVLDDDDYFGGSVASLGDLDGDGAAGWPLICTLGSAALPRLSGWGPGIPSWLLREGGNSA